MIRFYHTIFATLVALAMPVEGLAKDIVHDAEYYILKTQNGERWAAEDVALDQKLAALEEKFGQPPNIVYILWDDQQVGAVGNPMIQKNLGYTTPNLNRMATEGIITAD